jgi:hypothetical protein
MEMSTEYEENIEQFEVQYEINNEWALLFVNDSLVLEQFQITSENSDKDFIKKDITDEWKEFGTILHVLEKYIINGDKFIGDNGLVAIQGE